MHRRTGSVHCDGGNGDGGDDEDADEDIATESQTIVSNVCQMYGNPVGNPRAIKTRPNRKGTAATLCAKYGNSVGNSLAIQGNSDRNSAIQARWRKKNVAKRG